MEVPRAFLRGPSRTLLAKRESASEANVIAGRAQKKVLGCQVTTVPGRGGERGMKGKEGGEGGVKKKNGKPTAPLDGTP